MIHFKEFWNLQMLNFFQGALKKHCFEFGDDGIHVSKILLFCLNVIAYTESLESSLVSF